jgi:hypothetical protein
MKYIKTFHHPMKVYLLGIITLGCLAQNTTASQASSAPTTDATGNIETGVCALKDSLITVTNNGKTIGMVEVALLPSMSSEKTTIHVNTTKEKPNNTNERQLHMGYGSHNRQKLLFRGSGKVKCYACSGTANDPNDRAMCADPLDKNNCLKCSENPADCSTMLSIARCHAQGDPWAAQAEYERTEGQLKTPKDNLAIRLGLIQDLPKNTTTK